MRSRDGKVCRFYGRGRQDYACCKNCKIKRICKAAYIPDPPIEKRMIRLDEFEEIPAWILPETDDRPADWDVPRYSLAEVFEVIHRLLELDLKTIDYLAEIFRYPGITFTELALKKGVSRQAVHKWLKAEVDRHPELRPVVFAASKTLKKGKDVQE